MASPWFVGDHWPGASFGRACWETWSVEALGQARRLPDTATPFPTPASGKDEDWPGCMPSNDPLLGRFQERDSQWRRCSSFWSSTGRCTAQEKTWKKRCFILLGDSKNISRCITSDSLSTGNLSAMDQAGWPLNKCFAFQDCLIPEASAMAN